ncbi:iron chaperone [Nocardia sp. NBC_00511]|uniref:iron chaperone n=1 Tax=Nocardia sp. NBC_00511 TaxID=2903591 RepID=UPI0030E0F216
MDEAVAHYRDEIDPSHQPLFDRLHSLILDTFPDAQMTIAYGMPTYRVGRHRLNVGAWKHSLSLYLSPQRDGGFSARHPRLASGKGTIKLSADAAADIPDEEFRELIRAALGGE